MVLPLIRVERLSCFRRTVAVGVIPGLAGGNWSLSLSSHVFDGVSVPEAWPAARAAYGGHGAEARIPAWLRALSNWSMLDVVLVALVIFAAKTSGLATAFTKPGLWFFAASAVLTATASALARRQSRARLAA